MSIEIGPFFLDCVVDVSDNNRIESWERAYAAGIRLAFIKATQGRQFRSPTFEAQRDGARAAGIAVIPYHFITSDPPAQQAQNFVTDIPEGGRYALDWEGNRTLAATDVEALGINLTDLTGVSPIGYWGAISAPEPPTVAMLAWDHWLSRYRVPEAGSFADVPHYLCAVGGTMSFRFWQYSATGVVDGIEGNVDRSVANFASVEDMLAWVNGTPVAA